MCRHFASFSCRLHPPNVRTAIEEDARIRRFGVNCRRDDANVHACVFASPQGPENRCPASRPCLFCARQRRHGAAVQRPAAAAHRGYRCRPCRPEYEAAIYEDLRWLGIAWQQDVRRQSEHFDDYQSAVNKLEARACSIRASRAAARLPRWSPNATAEDIGRATRTACRSIPGAPAKCRRPSASGAAGRASPMRFGSPWTRPSRRPAS